MGEYCRDCLDLTKIGGCAAPIGECRKTKAHKPEPSPGQSESEAAAPQLAPVSPSGWKGTKSC